MTGAILIVTHNNLHLTKRAVRTALTQTVPCSVMVVDNGSTDNTVPWLRSRRRQAMDEGKQCMVLVPQFPLSLAACWNLGIESFSKAGCHRVLVLNNDVEIRPDTYEMLSSYMLYSCEEGLVSATAVDSPDQMDEWSVAHPVDLIEQRVPHPDFSCFMIESDTFRIVGPFDEEFYPCYCEDTDWHVRMHRAGILASKIPLPFFHHRSATLANASPEEREMIEAGAARNRSLFKEKYGCLPGTPEYAALFDQSSFGMGI